MRQILFLLGALGTVGCQDAVRPRLCVLDVAATDCAADERFAECLKTCEDTASPPLAEGGSLQILYGAAPEVSEGKSATVRVLGPCSRDEITVPMVDGRLRLVHPLPPGASCFFSVEVELNGTRTAAHRSGEMCSFDAENSCRTADAGVGRPGS